MTKKLIHDRFKPSSIAPIPNWNSASFQVINSLFSAADRGIRSFLVVLPYDVSPASLAVYASLHLMPNLSKEPEPHCRIALYPGRYFREDLEKICFAPDVLNRLCAAARVVGHYKVLTGTVQKLLKRLQKGKIEPVFFHWFWRCDRVWDHFGEEDREALGPRNHFGKNDSYKASIDLLINEELVLHPKHSYDILIYCPFYQRLFETDWEQRIADAKRIVSDFPADLKFTVVRSPYDYWARQLENVPSIEAIICTVKETQTTSEAIHASTNLKIVEQCLSLEECFLLLRAIGRTQLGKQGEEGNPLRFIHQCLRRFFAGLAPIEPEEGLLLGDDLRLAFSGLGLLDDPVIGEILDKICRWASASKNIPKLDVCLEIIKTLPNSEFWTTFETDRQSLQDKIATEGLSEKTKVKRTDRRMDFLKDGRGLVTVLTRIDRDSDLDWVSYLRPGDCIVMSTWEVAVRSGTIMRLWERSERWRENSRRMGLTSPDTKSSFTHDPVLDLADNLDKLRRNTLKKETLITEQQSDAISEWWDRIYRSRAVIPSVGRNEIIEQQDGFPCVEIHFTDGTGIFLREGVETQVFREADEDTEILGIDPCDLQQNDIVVLTKDEERGTILDIIIDHLRGTSQFGTDAEAIKMWKDSLRAAYTRRGMTIYSLAEAVTKSGGHADPATIRSWVLGGIMAPRDVKNLDALYAVLGIVSPSKETVEASVIRLRSILRVLGRLLNRFLMEREMSPTKRRDFEKLINQAGIDPDSIRAAVEIKSVKKVVSKNIRLGPNHIHHLFKLSPE